jgi:phosphonate transport system permease protein
VSARAVRELARRRPRNRFGRWSAGVMAVLMIGSWWVGGFSLFDLFRPERVRRVERFVEEATPWPVQGERFDLGKVLDWAGDLFARRGADAALRTLAISVVAIVLAALGALVLAPWAARTFAHPEPWLPGPGRVRPAVAFAWRATTVVARGALVFLRAIPEYVWAFLLLAMIGPSAWPAVLALAIHNSGILGRLSAETIENADRAPLAALRGVGATRRQVLMAGLFPSVLPRFLLYFFYRWETCVREATVLGMLGILSLGRWIEDAHVRFRYDDMVFYVLLASLIVMLGDAVSALARRAVRHAD